MLPWRGQQREPRLGSSGEAVGGEELAGIPGAAGKRLRGGERAHHPPRMKSWNGQARGKAGEEKET